MILITLLLVFLVPVLGLLGWLISSAMMAVSPFLFLIWFLFALFTLYFFRDPNSRVPAGANLVVSPATARWMSSTPSPSRMFMGGECQRISMFLSVLDVHVQNAPVSGKVALFKYTDRPVSQRPEDRVRHLQ